MFNVLENLLSLHWVFHLREEWKKSYEKRKVIYSLDSLYKLTYEDETRDIPNYYLG